MITADEKIKVLVTGSSGFVGRALCEYLRKSCEVVEYDLPEGDILDLKHYRNYIGACDFIVHLAAVADLYHTAADPDRTFYVNCEGTYYTAKLCAELKKKLVFISTCCVYGNTDHEWDDEETLPKTIEPYACSKVAGEYLVRGTEGLEYTILRIGTVYGPEMREALFNFQALYRVMTGQTVTVNGHGEQTRQYIYIDDLVKGIGQAVINFDKAQGHIINICGNESTSVNDSIRIAEMLTEKKAVLVRNLEGRYGEIDDERISLYKAFNILEWEPSTTFFDGMSATYKYDDRFCDDINLGQA